MKQLLSGFMKMMHACAFWILILLVLGKIIWAMCSKVPMISKTVTKATGCDSFNLLVNNGQAAGQVIYHSLRRHPLKLDQEASQLADCIRENLPSLNECEGSKGLATSLIGN